MTEAVIVALITGLVTLIGNILAIVSSSRKTANNLEKAQAVTDTKIDELTREVRDHNGFASRIPVIEARLDNLEKKVS